MFFKKSILTLAITSLFCGVCMANETGENMQISQNEIKNLNQKELNLTKISAFLASSNLSELKNAVNFALDNGMSVAEIKDTMAQLYAYCGFPKALNGLGVLSVSLKEREKMGLKTTQGTENKIIEKNLNSLEIGSKTQTDLVGSKVDLSALSADVDYYLKAHLFGDIFASEIFSWKEREIITVAALAAMSGTEPQRDAHIKIAKLYGVSDAQINEILEISNSAKFSNPSAMSKDEFAKISPFGVGELNSAYAKYFSGNSYLNAVSTEQVKMYNVVFEPSCRNNWHIHHAKSGGGQILIATAGRGYYQEWGKEAIEMKAGDVINIPAGVKHWHGAAKDSWFAHIAVEVEGVEASNEWLEPVSDEQYGKLR